MDTMTSIAQISDGGTKVQDLNLKHLGNDGRAKSSDLNAIQRMAILRSQKLLKRLEKALHKNEIAFYDHTIRRFQSDARSKDAIRSLASKFSIIASLQQALSN